MKRFHLIILVFAALFSACKPAYLITIHSTMKAGDRFVYRQTDQTETIINSDEADVATVQTKATDYEYTVLSVAPSGEINMQMRILRVQQDENQGGKTSHFDSNDPKQDQDDIQARMYKHLMSCKFTFVLQGDGRITSFKGFEEVWNKIEAEFADEPMVKPVLNSIRVQFSDENMGKQTAELWGMFPPKAVRVGQHWKKSITIEPFKFHRDAVYTLKSYDKNSAVIDIAFVSSNDPKDPGVLDLGVAKIEYYLKGTGVGQAFIDVPSNQLRKIDQQINMSGDMKVIMSMLGEQTMPTVLKLHNIVERIE